MQLESMELASMLQLDEDGAIRVGNTRVTLDSVVLAFRSGASAEQIAEKYPALELADVYAAIAYYLWNRESVNNYLAKRNHEEVEALREIGERWPREGIRQRLVSRLDADGKQP